eukprot:116297_1
MINAINSDYISDGLQKMRNILEENKFDLQQQEFDMLKPELANITYSENSLLCDVVDGYVGGYNTKSITELLTTKLKYSVKKRQRFYYILLTNLTKLEQMDQENFIKILKLIAFNIDPNVDLKAIEQISRQKQLNGNVFVKETTQYMGLGATKKFVKMFATTKNYNKSAWNQVFSYFSEWNLFENPLPIPGSIQHGQIQYDNIRNILEESKFDIEEHEFNVLESELKAYYYTEHMMLLELVNGYIGEYKHDKKSLAKILERNLKYSAKKRARFYYILLTKFIKQRQLDNDTFIKILKLIAINLHPEIDINKIAQIAKEQNLNGNMFINGSSQFKKFGNSNKFKKLFASITNYDTKLIFDQLSQMNLIENPIPIPGTVQNSKLLMAKSFQKFINQEISKNKMVEIIDKNLDIEYKPLHNFDSNDLQNVIVKYVLNDTKYDKLLSKTTQILLNRLLSGNKIISMGVDNCKQLLENDFLAFMTQETFDIMINNLKREINENPNDIQSKDPSQIANFIQHIPLNKLIQRIKNVTDVVDGETFITYDMDMWIYDITGWHHQEIYQIQAVLFQHNIFTDSVIKQKMKKIFDPHFGQLQSENILQKIVSQFDMAELFLKMIHNKNVRPFSDFVINLVDELQVTTTAPQSQPTNTYPQPIITTTHPPTYQYPPPTYP